MGEANIRGLRMKAREINEEGVWENEEVKLPLLGTLLPLPESIQTDGPREEVIMIVPASDYIKECPRCEIDVEGGVIIVTVNARMFPAHCCDTIMWYQEDDYIDMETE